MNKDDLLQSDIFSRFSTLSYVPRWCVLLLDTLLCTIAFLLSLWIGGDLFRYDHSYNLDLWQQYVIVMAVQIVCFWLFHTYSSILRYSTFADIIKVLIAVATAIVFLLLSNLFCQLVLSNKPLLNTQIIIYAFISFVLLISLRIGVKTLYEMVFQHNNNSPKVLIYGTKSAGLAIAKMLRSAGNTPYHPIGFISDDKQGMQYDLNGLHVFKLTDKLFEWMNQHHVHHVIISPIKMREINPTKDLSIFLEHNVQILTTPYFTNFDSSTSTNVGSIDAIKIEDLLERPTIHINTDNVNQIINQKVVMVTGAAGSIGSELVRQVLTYQPQAIILFEQAESPLHDLTMELLNLHSNVSLIPIIGDVRDRNRVEETFREYRPDVIYHAAAYKHVPLMENNPNEAIHANVMGTKNVADMAVKYGVERFIMISTDKAVNPTNIMGASKRIAEIYVQSMYKDLATTNPACTKFITTRFGNVLGSNGSVIPYFKKQIAAGGPVTVTHPEITRFFMTIPEACCLVLEASAFGDGGQIFVFDMGKPVKIVDLAKNMIRLAGHTPGNDIQIVFTGLRPGEKLYEELLNKKETTIPTQHEKIMIARVREFPFQEVNERINKLIEVSMQNKPFMTVEQMKAIVPEFISKNSVYEQLDK